MWWKGLNSIKTGSKWAQNSCLSIPNGLGSLPEKRVLDPFLTRFWSQQDPVSRLFGILLGPKPVTTGSKWAKTTCLSIPSGLGSLLEKRVFDPFSTGPPQGPPGGWGTGPPMPCSSGGTGGARKSPQGAWVAREDYEGVLRAVVREGWPDRGPAWPAYLEGGAVLRVTDAEANNWVPRALRTALSHWCYGPRNPPLPQPQPPRKWRRGWWPRPGPQATNTGGRERTNGLGHPPWQAQAPRPTAPPPTPPPSAQREDKRQPRSWRRRRPRARECWACASGAAHADARDKGVPLTRRPLTANC